MPPLDAVTPNVDFNFSDVQLGQLESEQYTLVNIAVDASSSIKPFAIELEKCVRKAVGACVHAPRADNLLIRITKFNKNLNVVHNFKLLTQINVATDYDNFLQPSGMTALYRAVIEGYTAITTMAKQLIEKDYYANAINIVITDGDNTESETLDQVQEVAKAANKTEALESMVNILVRVNAQEYEQKLNELATAMGIPLTPPTPEKPSQIIDIQNASEQAIARLAQFISNSINAQSNACGTGGPSKPITF